MKPIFLLILFLAASQMAVLAQDTARNPSSTKVEIEAEYPGGQPGWLKYLVHNFRYPDDAVNNEIQGTVIVQFIVNTDSTISDIQAISGPKKGGLREEAIRVVKLSGKWVPAVQNGIAVKSYKKQPVSFKIVKG
jgi:protein TonB